MTPVAALAMAFLPGAVEPVKATVDIFADSAPPSSFLISDPIIDVARTCPARLLGRQGG